MMRRRAYRGSNRPQRGRRPWLEPPQAMRPSRHCSCMLSRHGSVPCRRYARLDRQSRADISRFSTASQELRFREPLAIAALVAQGAAVQHDGYAWPMLHSRSLSGAGHPSMHRKLSYPFHRCTRPQTQATRARAALAGQGSQCTPAQTTATSCFSLNTPVC